MLSMTLTSYTYFLLIGLIISCASSKVFESPCQNVSLSNNTSSDTNKVVLKGMVRYDTLASEVRGTIIDNITFLPIVNATVTIKKTGRQFSDTTNSKGFFWVDKNGFEGEWTMTIVKPAYNCLTIDSMKIESGEGIDLTIKLTKRT
jgi:hypothetical protein